MISDVAAIERLFGHMLNMLNFDEGAIHNPSKKMVADTMHGEQSASVESD
jgi:hypothetical protein